MKRLEQWANELERKTREWRDRALLEAEARRNIKTENFSSELEKEVMLEAAQKEQARVKEWSTMLDSDPKLKSFFDSSLNELIAENGKPSDLMEKRIFEDVALERAQQQMKIEAWIGDDEQRRKDFDEAYEKASAVLKALDAEKK